MAKLPSRILHTEQICGKQVIQERSYIGKELCKELLYGEQFGECSCVLTITNVQKDLQINSNGTPEIWFRKDLENIKNWQGWSHTAFDYYVSCFKMNKIRGKLQRKGKKSFKLLNFYNEIKHSVPPPKFHFWFLANLMPMDREKYTAKLNMFSAMWVLWMLKVVKCPSLAKNLCFWSLTPTGI